MNIVLLNRSVCVTVISSAAEEPLPNGEVGHADDDKHHGDNDQNDHHNTFFLQQVNDAQ